MKIAVVGTGAMGSTYAGLLSAAGHEVWAIDTWVEHIDAINRDGLRVEGASGDRVARLSASTSTGDPGVCDLVIIATKADGVTAAARSIDPLLGPESVVLTIQNGLGSAERIVEAIGPERVLVGIAGGFGASIRTPGHAHHTGWETVRIGELAGAVSPRLRAVVDVWRNAGFPAEVAENVHRMIWEKFICNVGFSGICTLTGLKMGEVTDNPDAWEVGAGCAREAWEVARALEVGVRFDDPVAHVREYGRAIAEARPSMALDHLAGKRSEVDVLNGAVPVQARKVGLRAPYNEVVSALVRQRETQFAT
ncbi:ketopantoate reductase [Antricoccus suffuscus]|uniref:2-dehydropantoate 2-reductase n=1 Tax=Antricoccus suffuscus TaxID=1629062 RepID=A0A2T1A6Z5_9ACTN|nr:2-dehydropantoate 2-reductase [Antricoccus suffuscus]PRZ44382.1 ketopantoate reductase [Antricoccus suffuscus]